MGFFDSLKANMLGAKAYRRHLNGMQLRKQGKFEEGEQKLNEAVKLYNDAYAAGFRKSAALQGYALLLMRQSDFVRAREIMLESNKDKTMSAENRFSLRVDYSICQWKMGNLDKAIETIKMAAEYKKNCLIYNTLGMYLIERGRVTGDFEEAIQLNAEAYEYDDEDAGTLDNMGQLNLALSEKAAKEGDKAAAAELRGKAKEFFAKAYDTKPEQVSSSYFYAKVLNEDGEKPKAREVMNNLVKIPVSGILQICKADIDALRKQIG